MQRQYGLLGFGLHGHAFDAALANRHPDCACVDGIAFIANNKEDWVGRRLVADKFRDRRVFICGDAAHLWVPMAGYGMNAGIADAMNLSWQLAAALKGWGAEGILKAHEAERQPITEQVSKFAMNHALALQEKREGVPTGIEQEGAIGEGVRKVAGQTLYDLNVKQYCCGGLNFGYFYDASPLIAYDGESAPAYTMDQFTPSTVPGCCTPQVKPGLHLATGRRGVTLRAFAQSALRLQ